MDIDNGLLQRLLVEGKVLQLVDSGFGPEMVSEDYQEPFAFVMDFWRDHGVVPTSTTVMSKFPGFKLEEVQEPLDFWIEECQKRFVHNELEEEIRAAAEALQKGEPFEALDSFKQRLVGIDIGVRRSKDVNMTQNIDSRLERVRLAMKMVREEGQYMAGIPTPWARLNREILGLQPGHMKAVVSRTNIGKTWSMCILGGFAWLNSFRPLFISKEMRNEEIQSRFDAFLSKLAARRLRRGTFSDQEFESYKEYLADMREGHDLWISSDDPAGGVSHIAAKIEQYRPDIVLVDGFYLIQDELRAGSSWERYMNISRGIKRLAMQKDLPIVVSTQFNRDQSSTKTTGYLENMAFSDALAQDSDVVVAMFQTQELRDNRQMKMSLLKAREGELIDWVTHWNFDTMNFDELEDQEKTVEEIENEEEVEY